MTTPVTALAAVAVAVGAAAPAAVPPGEWVQALPWLTVLGLGAIHGINPGMGWLFAVGLGLQERRGAAVWRALPGLALGHGLAIGSVVGAAALIGFVVPVAALRWVVAALLLGLGVYRLVRNRHPRYGGMQVGARELTVWSFLMASAHGAGLMVLPFVLGGGAASRAVAGPASHAAHMAHGMTPAGGAAGAGADALGSAGGMVAAGLPGAETGLLLTLVHTGGYLLVTGLVALVVYHKLGLRLLRTAWVNMDVIWAGALVLTALVTPFL